MTEGLRVLKHWTPPVVLALLATLGCGRRPAPASAAVTVAVPFELATLDPHAEDKLSSLALLANIYEPLVGTDADMGLRPALARAWESPEPLTWVFHLRSDVRFQSGRPLRAGDVVYSFERILQSRGLEIRNYLLDVEDVTRIDDQTVRIRMRVPTRILLNRLAHVFVVPDGESEERLGASADGTGPYALAQWKRDESLRLVRNERYWGAPPAVREATFELGRSPEQAVAGLVAGRTQLIRADLPDIEARLAGASRFALLRHDNLFGKYLAYDLSRDATPYCKTRPNPFKDLRVRRALHAGIDRRRLVARLGSRAVPATQPIPRFVFGFDPTIPEPALDREQARALLKDAGLGKGFEVVLHARKVMSEAAREVRDDLAQIGVLADLRMLPDGEFFGLVGRRGATIWLNRFGCLTGDATEWLNDLVHSPDPERHLGSINYGGHSDRDLDRAIEAVAWIEKPEERRTAIQELVGKAMDRLLVIPLYNDVDVYAVERSLSWQPRTDSYILAAEIAPRTP